MKVEHSFVVAVRDEVRGAENPRFHSVRHFSWQCLGDLVSYIMELFTNAYAIGGLEQLTDVVYNVDIFHARDGHHDPCDDMLFEIGLYGMLQRSVKDADLIILKASDRTHHAELRLALLSLLETYVSERLSEYQCTEMADKIWAEGRCGLGEYDYVQERHLFILKRPNKEEKAGQIWAVIRHGTFLGFFYSREDASQFLASHKINSMFLITGRYVNFEDNTIPKYLPHKQVE
jgi:hypothetical protein